MTTIKQILQNIKSETDKALTALEKPVDRFVPEYSGQSYFYLDSFGYVESELYDGDDVDRFRILTGNCYRTKEQAERARDIINRIGNLRGDWLPDWGDTNKEKYYPFKDHEGGHWMVDQIFVREEACLYMPTEQDAQTLIDEFGDDLLLVMRRL